MNLPKLCETTPATKRGAARRFYAALAAYKRAYAGGGAFGWDWPTLRANEPELYAYFKTLNALNQELPN